jgi:nuclear transport factor 2 (NTF2) superfamily protein
MEPPPLPPFTAETAPFTAETAARRVRIAEDAWNTRDAGPAAGAIARNSSSVVQPYFSDRGL